jgi:hypothetical protein
MDGGRRSSYMDVLVRGPENSLRRKAPADAISSFAAELHGELASETRPTPVMSAIFDTPAPTKSQDSFTHYDFGVLHDFDVLA